MKNLFKLIGSLSLTLALLLFLYGSIKTVRAEEEGTKTIEMGQGIIVVQESHEQNKADKSLNYALASFVIGGACLSLGFMNQNKK